MKNFFLILVCSYTVISFSQSKQFKISGTLTSESENLPLESATVYLERVKDSTLVTYTISDKHGKFTLEDETSDKNLNLFVSYVGYATYKKTIAIKTTNIALGKIALKTDANALDEVLLKSRAPITIKKDTLEFNVKAFKTKKDANVEDLLKQLPGVEVDENGKIKVNGKEVNKILVNGKPFFGDDPTITTRNLTKEIIEKVQITDTKTKAEAFSGEEGDKENKTINLTIKKENNKGVFGRLAAGAGTDERYEFAGMFNRFDNDQRISVLAGGNNINSVGFSFGEIRKMFGGGNSISTNSNGAFTIDGRSFGGGEGISTSKNIGANYVDKLGEKVDLSADYFYSESNSDNKTTRDRENFLPDSRYFSSSSSKSFNDNQSHSGNLGFDIKIDSTLLINIQPNFKLSKNTTSSSRDETSRDALDDLINQSTSTSFVETLIKSFSNKFNLTKRFGNKGAFLKFSIDNAFKSTESEDFLNSETNIISDSSQDILRDQLTDGDKAYSSLTTSATYRLPLVAKKVFLVFKYSYRSDKTENLKSTFDKDNVLDQYTNFNSDLSTDFEYLNERSTPSLKLIYRKDKLSTSFETSYVFRTLENTDFLRPNFSLKRNFEAVELRYNLRYRFSPKSSMYVGYNLNNTPPNISQLQPFQNVSNPLNTIIGNPNLEPSSRHRIYFGYNAFDFQKKTGFYSYLSASFNNNQVVSKTTINDTNLLRETTYENVNGNYNVNGSLNYSKSIKVDTLKTLKYGIGIHGNIIKNINFNNEQQYASKVRSISPNISLIYTWKNVLEIIPRYSLTFTKNKYDLAAFEDRNFMYHDLSINTALFLPKKFEWRNIIDYNYNPNIADGFQKSAWFWNSTLAYSFMKENAVLTLKAYDLLKQNTNARRSATQNYIEDSQSTVLKQYFMLSFSWKFNSLGKKGETRKDNMFFYH